MDFDTNYGLSVHLMSPTLKISLFKKQTRNVHTKIYNKPPHAMSNIRFVGKIGIVQVYDKKINSNLDNRGIHSMFIGYSKDHKDDMYRMLNIKH